MAVLHPDTQAKTTQHLVSIIFFIQEKKPKKKVFQPHTGGVWVGGRVSVHPAQAPSPCGFGSNKGCGVMAPKIKMVYVCVGRRGVQKQWGVTDEVSTGNAAGGRPFHDISC